MKIFVPGGSGFLGKAVCRNLEVKNIDYCQTSLSQGVDFRKEKELFEYLEKEKPDIIINCAAYVGGIQFGYKHPAELFRNNLLMVVNIIEAAKIFNIKRVVNPISNCSYPGKASLFKEKEWWNGPLHESVMVYGMARKMFWVGSQAYNTQYGLDFINLILPNMYGPGDLFEAERSHALGALIMKFVRAMRNSEPNVVVWGTGKPVREWLYVEDGAEILVKALEVEPCIEPINVGVGKGISILELAELIKEIVGYTGKITLDTSKLDGAPYKTMDNTRLKKIFNWVPPTSLRKGIEKTVKWYIENEWGC